MATCRPSQETVANPVYERDVLKEQADHKAKGLPFLVWLVFGLLAVVFPPLGIPILIALVVFR